MSPRRILLAAVLLLSVACHHREEAERKHLLAKLRDGRPTVRISALQMLAPDATREEIAAMARTAHDGDESVRIAVAQALGRAPDPSAIDELGFLLHDHSDAVRAAAVHALLGRKGDHAVDYIVHAYESGGPLTRAEISGASADTFRRAVTSEANHWRERMEKEKDDDHETIRAVALSESGRDATPPVIGELSSRLVDPSPAMAAAAAAGLAHARASDQVPALIGALHYPSDLVVEAAAVALGELDPSAASSALAASLSRAGSREVAMALLDALDDAALLEPARAALCRAALAATDPEVAVREARLAGASCEVPSELPEGGPALRAQLLVLAELGHANGAAHRRALPLLKDPDAGLAGAAAVYLGRLGSKSDGPLLAAQAQAELVALREARAKQAQAEQPPPPTKPAPNSMEAFLAQIAKMEGKTQAPIPTPKLNRLQQLIADRTKSDRTEPFESRPGELALLGALSTGAAGLGADGLELATALFNDDATEVRLLAPDVANLMGDAGEPLREKIRADGDVQLKLRMALLDWQANRPGALDRLAVLVPSVDVDGRMEIAAAMAGHESEAKAILLSLLSDDDTAAPLAARALSNVPGADVDAALINRLSERPDLVGYTAIVALKNRTGASVENALAVAAVSPSPDLRGAAMEALASRKACGVADRLAPLSMDYDGYVRSQVGVLEKACGK